MGSKVNYKHAINFLNLFHIPPEQGNQKNKAESRKTGLRFLPMNFPFLCNEVYSLKPSNLLYRLF